MPESKPNNIQSKESLALLIPFYRDILVRAVPTNSTSPAQCILTKWLRDIAESLQILNMRVYLFNDKNNSIVEKQIVGDKDIWKSVDVLRLNKDNTMHKSCYYLKIRHIRENGQFLTLGYLTFKKDSQVSEGLLKGLDVLCILYGNYIVKRLVAGYDERRRLFLPKVFSIAASSSLPGTKISSIIETIYKLSRFCCGLFCTVSGASVVPEYVARNKNCSVIRKNTAFVVDPSFISICCEHHSSFRLSLAHLPDRITSFLLYQEDRPSKAFSALVFPAFVDKELVALWFFVFPENSIFTGIDTDNVLESVSPLLLDTYRFLFQRRFESMIVNPIFQNRDTRINPDSVFVIMPFSEPWSDEIWKQALKPAIQEIGMKAIRADDLYGQKIMEDVWQSILQSAIVVCDTTGRNPNVFYELGIAHTLGKKVLLLTQNIDDIPFDLREFRHIEYSNTISGGSQLKENLKNHIRETLSEKKK